MSDTTVIFTGAGKRLGRLPLTSETTPFDPCGDSYKLATTREQTRLARPPPSYLEMCAVMPSGGPSRGVKVGRLGRATSDLMLYTELLCASSDLTRTPVLGASAGHTEELAAPATSFP